MIYTQTRLRWVYLDVGYLEIEQQRCILREESVNFKAYSSWTAVKTNIHIYRVFGAKHSYG